MVERVPLAHVALALLVTIIWGVAFVATRVALDDFSPAALTALRFLVAALPAALLPRPRVSWQALVLVGLTLYTGQFLFQFLGIAAGMPPGLAAIVVQTQALFTIVLAALAAGERPTGREWTRHRGGLRGPGRHRGHGGRRPDRDRPRPHRDVRGELGRRQRAGQAPARGRPARPRGLAEPRAAPARPGARRAVDGPRALGASARGASWLAVAAVLYLGLVATVLAYAIWGYLLRRHSAAQVAPFALLVPFVAAASSALVLGERFGPRRLVGMGLVLLGLAIIMVRPGLMVRPGAAGLTEPPRRSR